VVEESGVDRVLVAIAGEIVEISRRDRDTLLQELCLIPGCKAIREKFEAAGSHRWVELDGGQRSRLRTVVEVCGTETACRPRGSNVCSPHSREWTQAAWTCSGMGAGRLDRVHLDVAGELVELSWDERDELLERIRIVAEDEPIVAKLEAVGASGPVELDEGERAQLRMVLKLWEAVTVNDLPDGIAALRDALVAGPGGL
jgi:hypothetical protein